MDENAARGTVIETGRSLLEQGLVARTWGNISCRLDEETFLITPSGLSYRQMKEEDLPVCRLDSKEWTGPYKPSSEAGIHRAAYRCFLDAGFVIHTHQTYASAIGVDSIEPLDLTAVEEEMLEGLALAEYGLPGTKKLMRRVQLQLETGAHTILMRNHGALIVGRDCQEAMERALLLEEICRRHCQGQKLTYELNRRQQMDRHVRELMLLNLLHKKFPTARLVQTDAVLLQAEEGLEIPAQLDDMAQMIGRKIPVERNGQGARAALEKFHAVLVPGVGGIVAGADEEDTEALAVLMNKSAVTARHAAAVGVKAELGLPDRELMHLVYQKKYSRKRDGGKNHE